MRKAGYIMNDNYDESELMEDFEEDSEDYEKSEEDLDDGEKYNEDLDGSEENIESDSEELALSGVDDSSGIKEDLFLKLTSDAFTRRSEKILIKQIGFTDPIKKGRQNTITGLTKTVKDLGVLQPIHVMTVPEESEDEDYKYVLLDGVRRVFGALRNGQTEIDAIVWDFKDKDQGVDLALYISLLLNRNEKRSWGEAWHLYQVLELQSAITPGTLEYLLQLQSGDAMKLKDVMLCDYEEVKQALLNNEKDLESCYKMLGKLRKEEDRLAMEDATGVDKAVEGAEDIKSDSSSNNESESLSEQDVLELLEMSDLDDLDDLDSDDFNDLVSQDSDFIGSQEVGDRHMLDPEIKQAVLQRDKFTCQCCGLKMVGARFQLIAIHHKIPVHVVEDNCDRLDNLITLDLNCHLSLHVMERAGGSILMSEEMFNELPESDQITIKKIRKLALLAIDADKRKGLSKDDVREATKSVMKHPMPGTGMEENKKMYEEAVRNGSLDE